jgi:hypothetical protein
MMSERYRTRAFLYCSAVAVLAVCRVVEAGLSGDGAEVAKAVASDLFMGRAKLDRESRDLFERVDGSRLITLLWESRPNLGTSAF